VSGRTGAELVVGDIPDLILVLFVYGGFCMGETVTGIRGEFRELTPKEIGDFVRSMRELLPPESESGTRLRPPGPPPTARSSRGTAGSNLPRSATESLSLGILRPDHRIARASGLICNCVVAEKPTFLKVMGNSRPKSLLANLARPFGN
jgi:hypothetical protein